MLCVSGVSSLQSNKYINISLPNISEQQCIRINYNSVFSSEKKNKNKIYLLHNRFTVIIISLNDISIREKGTRKHMTYSNY